MIKTDQQRLPSFISHPNGIVLRVLKRQRSLKDFVESENNPSEIVLHALKQKRSTLPSSSSMVTMEMETETNRNAEQHVKQLKSVKQRANWQHYSHVHHWPPQQQYKSKNWNIAIILKLTFVALDSWTYRIRY